MTESRGPASQTHESHGADDSREGVHLGLAPGEVLTFTRGSFVVVGGCVGAGKSTLVERLAVDPDVRVLSLDELRRDVQEERGGDRGSYDPRCWYEAEKRFGQALDVSLAQGVTVVADLTALKPEVHEYDAMIARDAGRELHLVMVDASVDECLRAQVTRPSAIPTDVVYRYHQLWAEMRYDLQESPQVVLDRGLRSVTVLSRAEARQVERLHLV